MDPNATLERLRKLVTELREAELSDPAVQYDIATEMASNIEALDNWLSTNGFLPERWERGTR